MRIAVTGLTALLLFAGALFGQASASTPPHTACPGQVQLVVNLGNIGGIPILHATCINLPAGPAGPAGAPGITTNFMDDDTAAVSNADGTWTLSKAPSPATSLQVFVNGLRYKSGVDFSLNGNTVTFLMPTGNSPQSMSNPVVVFTYRF